MFGEDRLTKMSLSSALRIAEPQEIAHHRVSGQ